MKRLLQILSPGVVVAALAILPASASASSHMDAPLITLDDPANTTDVYAFLSIRNGEKYLTTALAVYPFEEPGIGPNTYRFDDDVKYEIHVATGNDVAKGEATISYAFQFDTKFKNENTTLQSFLGVVQEVDDANQNLVQTYRVTRVDRKKGRDYYLGTGTVPPNNQGVVTPKYNVDDDGENPARPGVTRTRDLDDYTRRAIFELRDEHRVFAGQRDDGFYADIQGVFDLLNFNGPNKPFDSQGGFNVHTIVLEIPLRELGGERQVVGVYATTSRRKVTVLSDSRDRASRNQGPFVQVARQGNPLFNEGLVALRDKDFYNRSRPTVDHEVFRKYAEKPELAVLLNAVLGTDAITTGRIDIAGIFIPDVIKVDLSTRVARRAGNPDDEGFHRLSIFGGDVLKSQVQPGFFGNGTVPGGWPNGRRFGDDVLDIVVIALLSDLRDPENPVIGGGATTDIDKVTANDITYNRVFPYAATPLNGRNHPHH
ncbi:MAG: DUF4331 domain-containing protein [Gemmatimonadales bacterium]|nr:DUF4331 domain-containing protein [Gemmatimonadales bacterium]